MSDPYLRDPYREDSLATHELRVQQLERELLAAMAARDQCAAHTAYTMARTSPDRSETLISILASCPYPTRRCRKLRRLLTTERRPSWWARLWAKVRARRTVRQSGVDSLVEDIMATAQESHQVTGNQMLRDVEFGHDGLVAVADGDSGRRIMMTRERYEAIKPHIKIDTR